jgi:hypothetical protein
MSGYNESTKREKKNVIRKHKQARFRKKMNTINLNIF